jgi:hypothetical protein
MMAHLAMLAPNETARHMVLTLLGDELDEAKFYNNILCADCGAKMPVCPGAGYQPDLPCPPGTAPGAGYPPGMPCPPHHDPCPKPGHPPSYLKPAGPGSTLAPSVPVEAPGLFPGLYPGVPPGIPLAEKENEDDKK